MAKVPTSTQVASWRAAMKQSGMKRLKARALLGAFGAQRRGKEVTVRITEWLAALDPPIYASGLEWLDSLDEQVRLTPKPEEQIGALAEYEEDVTARFKSEIMKKIGLAKLIQAEYSPVGTRRRFDFLCEDKKGTKVIVEIKRWEGEAHGVQQLLHYLRTLRKDVAHGTDEVRGIFITGVADQDTRTVFEELAPEYGLLEWWIYGITDDGKLIVKRVDIEPARKSRP